MSWRLAETIVAEATPRGSGGRRSIVRISGERAYTAAATLFAEKSVREKFLHETACAESAFVFAGKIEIWHDAAPLDSRFYIWHCGKSYTGDATVEIHLLNSPLIIAAVIQKILTTQNVRLAQRGEMTLRAVLSGRIDLTQAEAVYEVIAARDVTSLETALAQLAGNVRHPLTSLDDALSELCAECEALLDFPDEDFLTVAHHKICERIEKIEQEIIALRNWLHMRGEASDLPSVVLLGKPNVGKSSLWNALIRAAGEKTGEKFCEKIPAAITSPEAGTTRDTLAADLHSQPIPFRLIDTAGEIEIINDAQKIVIESQRRRAEAMHTATICLACFEKCFEKCCEKSNAVIRVLMKADLIDVNDSPDENLWRADISVSSYTSRGIENLLALINQRLAQLTTSAVPTTSVRVDAALAEAAESLREARVAIETLDDLALAADNFRLSAAAIRRGLGKNLTPDDLLNSIFSRFCIGK